MVCSPVDLEAAEAAEAAFFSAGAGDEGGGDVAGGAAVGARVGVGGGGGDVAGDAAVGARVGVGGGGVVVAGVGDVGSHAAAAAATSAGDDGGASPMLRRSARAHSLNKLLAFLCIVCRLCTVEFCCIKMNFLLFFDNEYCACSATAVKAAYASS